MTILYNTPQRQFAPNWFYWGKVRFRGDLFSLLSTSKKKRDMRCFIVSSLAQVRKLTMRWNSYEFAIKFASFAIWLKSWKKSSWNHLKIQNFLCEFKNNLAPLCNMSHCLDLYLNDQKTRRNFWCVPGILGTYSISK